MPHDRSLAELEADFADVARRGTQAPTLPATHTTLLHIGDEHLVVLSGRGATPETVQQIDLGVARVARDYFRHELPSSQDIERAIDHTEDEIMRLGTAADAGSTLWCTSAALQAWARLSGPTIPIETVEHWFQRLAAASPGQPAAMQGLPSGREAAAGLLVLREYMHHRGHAAVVLLESRSAPGPVDAPAVHR